MLVVTGASRGLGVALSLAALETGYRVIGVARSAVAGLPYEVRACDVSDAGQVAKLFRSLHHESGLYGLINAAGIASMNLTLTTPPETMQRLVATNLLGTMYCSSAMGRLLARRGCGRIINFSSIAVPLGLKGEAVYVGAKSGIEGFSRAFAREMADFNVTVNVVAPGPMRTALIQGVPEPAIETLVRSQVVPRMAQPEDLWHLVAFLLDEGSSMLSGQVFHLGGV
ncbi:SDR family NAD(P)-dependent oxidoreductase [Thiocystis violacea]|uniref:SDR family NAD(P)-dependent oxidoreductase n=1 Tax=Thiocystis violacea TaxID=13725 RepID=UPI001907B8C0|nr:SDR family oxidoreductase [Thiocystis violacea]MBK1720024.1 3-oxoacyl-ACP reductase [Thiocystis violacea]